MIRRFLKLHVHTCQVFPVLNTKYLTKSRKNIKITSVTEFDSLTEKINMDEEKNKEDVVKEINPQKRSLEMMGDIETEDTSKKLRFQKKKKVAMLLSFCGQGYFGMQINHGFKTIEGELFQAFLKLGIMDEESFKFPQSIHFQRAARTDKGVSFASSVALI